MKISGYVGGKLYTKGKILFYILKVQHSRNNQAPGRLLSLTWASDNNWLLVKHAEDAGFSVCTCRFKQPAEPIVSLGSRSIKGEPWKNTIQDLAFLTTYR
jgi:hypothetical protein